MPGLRVLTDAVHAEGAAISAQLGHEGPAADPRGNKAAGALAEHPLPQHRRPGSPRKATPKDLDRITLRPCGLRPPARSRPASTAVEVHLGHSYLASAFLSPKINHRTDEYGGSLLNRARFGRGILRAVRDAVGDRTSR